MNHNKFILILLVNFFVYLPAWATQILPYKDNLKIEKPGLIAICCVFQHEAAWLKEWIEFHRMIGVEHFYLYNNLSNDDYLSVLQPYISKGIVELYDYPHESFDQRHQIHLYNHALKLAKADQIEWLAIIDTDEFITPMDCNSLKKVLKQYKFFPGVSIQWLMFGTSNVDHLKEGQLMIEQLVYRAPEKEHANIFVKPIVQPQLTKRSISPHECTFHNKAFGIDLPIKIVRINHYYFRTEEFLHNVKIPRIRKRFQLGTNNVCSDTTILKFRPVANSVLDDTMERFIKPLKKRVFRLDVP